MRVVQVAKRFFTDPQIRFRYLTKIGFYNHLSDEEFIQKEYRVMMGKDINLDDPQTFNEKVNWLKLHDRKHIYTSMVDKYAAKEWAGKIIGEEHIVPCYGVWDHFDDIDFDKLPDQFVLKCNHDSGGVVICEDKSKLDKKEAHKLLQDCLKRNYYYHSREWPYKDVPRRIIAEKYMEDSDVGLIDYKFYCFNGEPKFLYISQGLKNHSTARIDYVSFRWKKLPFYRKDFERFEKLPNMPVHMDEMINDARKLSESTYFCRVDMYEIHDRVYFGEVTFSPGGGYTKLYPDDWDLKLGRWIRLARE